MPGDALVRLDYTPRTDPEYFNAEAGEVAYQPDVYTDAAAVAASLGARQIIDLGCGDALKLSLLADRFSIVGVDFGPNIAACRATYAYGTWVEHNLDAPAPLDVVADRSVLVCADVIEHVKRPMELAEKVLRLLHNGALAALISTPERDVTHGIGQSGPPPNPAHAREWTIRELDAFLRRCGFEHGSLGLTRNNTVENRAATILAVYVAREDLLPTVEDVLIDAPLPFAAPPHGAAPRRRRIARRLGW